MRNAGLLTAAIGAIALVAALATPGGAQPFSRDQLVRLGNDHFIAGRCLDSSMNYYALLQQFTPTLGAEAIGKMQRRITQCRGVGGAGINGKGDTDLRPIVLPAAPAVDVRTLPTHQIVGTLAPSVGDDAAETPRIRACRAYAETAVAQTRRLGATECGRRGGYRPFTHQQLYDWCTRQATPENVQADANRRAQALNSCTLNW